MAYLVLGLILFLGIHSISIIAPGWRDRAAARFGNAWRGIYSLVSIVGFVLIISQVASNAHSSIRSQRPIHTAPPTKLNDVIVIVAGLALYVVFVEWLHVRWIGVQPLPL